MFHDEQIRMALQCAHCHQRPPRAPGQRYCVVCHAAYQQRHRKAIKARTIAQINLLLAEASSPHRVIGITYAGKVLTARTKNARQAEAEAGAPGRPV
jgi:hypothetical protein